MIPFLFFIHWFGSNVNYSQEKREGLHIFPRNNGNHLPVSFSSLLASRGSAKFHSDVLFRALVFSCFAAALINNSEIRIPICHALNKRIRAFSFKYTAFCSNLQFRASRSKFFAVIHCAFGCNLELRAASPELFAPQSKLLAPV